MFKHVLAATGMAAVLAASPVTAANPTTGHGRATIAAATAPTSGEMGHTCHRGDLCVHVHLTDGSYQWIDLRACRCHTFKKGNFPTWYINNQTGGAVAWFAYTPYYVDHDGTWGTSAYGRRAAPSATASRGEVPHGGQLQRSYKVKPCGVSGM